MDNRWISRDPPEHCLPGGKVTGSCCLAYETPSTRIYQLRDEDNSFGGRTGAVAIKFLVNEKSHPDQVRRLYNEYIISRRHLISKCSAIRAALRCSNENGLHAIYLEWAAGVTLKEYICSIEQQSLSSEASMDPQDMLCGLVRLAYDISGAVSMIHEAGVVHNAISCHAIILDKTNVSWKESFTDGRINGTDATFNVKIIGLGSATLFKQNDAVVSMSAVKQDLAALGVVLEELFSINGSLAKTKPNDAKESSVSTRPGLNEAGMDAFSIRIPYSISSLVSRLRRGGDYCSAKEVQKDLEQILDHPERFLVELDSNTVMGDLHFLPEMLYGRETEMSMLLDTYSRIRSRGSRTEVVLVSGISGSGKSSLIRHFQKALETNGVCFLSGKFDQLCQVEPLSAVIASFTAYSKIILGGSQGIIDQTRKNIYKEVGNEGISILFDLVPGFREVIGVGTPTNASGRVEVLHAREQVKHVLYLLLRAIAQTSHPPVFFLDDLQWADPSSIDLVKTLITGNESTPILFIGCYRENEVTSSHPLSVELQEIERQNVPIRRIKLGRIERNAMNHLIADTLCSPRSLTKSLSDTVYDKTNGNAFFAIQLLKSLCDDEDGLTFSSTSGSWQWDLANIESNLVANTSAELIAHKLLQLPAEIRGALEVAACLGSHCDEACLRLISDKEFVEAESPSCDSDTGSCLMQMMTFAVGRGLMNKAGSRFEFTHDQIQQAAYMLIPEGERSALHHMIGTRIWKRSSPEQFKDLLFVAVDQLLMGSSYNEKNDHVKVAMLYLQAGQKAMVCSFFSTAAAYLKAGIESLGQGLWDNHYDLSLQLHNACAECELSNGKFDDLGAMADSILTHATCFEDQIIAYSTLLNSRFATNKPLEAIRIGFVVLEQLGEIFPKPDSGAVQAQSEHARTLNMLDGFTDETIVTMDAMRDSEKLVAMTFLHSLIMYSYCAVPSYFPIVTFRAVQLSLCYGVCKESAFAFASYGAVLCTAFGSVENLERAYRFGRISLQLIHRFGSMECLAGVYAVLYGAVNFWNEHITLGIEPLLRGHQIGMVFGDIEKSMSCAYICSTCSLHSGKHVAILEEELGRLCKKAMKFKQEHSLVPATILRQTLQNIMGQSDDPLQLTGECMKEDEAMADFLEHSNQYAISLVYRHRMWLACYFGDFTLAAEMADRLRHMDRYIDTAPWTCNHVFYDGLTSAIQAQRTKDRKWNVLAKKAMAKLEDWAVNAPCNVQHKILLLQAEFDCLEEDYIKAGISYESAIAVAEENGFMHEKALACERAAAFKFERGDASAAADYFDQAHDSYSEWGAIGKANHLRDHSLDFFIADSR